LRKTSLAQNQNRMNTPITLEQFATLCREFIHFCSSQPQHESHSNDLEPSFDRLAVSLFRLQFTHNPAYRRLCESRNVTASRIAHWFEIPSAPTSSFRLMDMSCLPPQERTSVFHSSGTTEQQPSRHYHNARSLALYDASLLPWFNRYLLAESEMLATGKQSPHALLSLTPLPTEVPHSSLAHMFATIERNMQCREAIFVGELDDIGGWGLDAEKTVTCLKRAIDLDQPVLTVGTAFSFVHLLDCLTEQGLQFQLPPGSRVMETGGYKGRSRTLTRSELHGLITAQLGIPAENIVCEYGMTELSSQAYDRAIFGTAVAPNLTTPKRHFHFPPWTRVQIISPETGREVADGETGLIRVFDLANVYSVLAIQTEDLGVRRGSGFELLGRAQAAEPRGCSLAAASL
jgi:hypothetical protein